MQTSQTTRHEPGHTAISRSIFRFAVLGLILGVTGAANGAICPRLQAEYNARQGQLHRDLVTAQRVAHETHRERIIALNYRRSHVSKLCPPERAHALRQLNYQQSAINREFSETLHRVRYKHRVARNQLNAWYDRHRHASYCGSCGACSGHVRPYAHAASPHGPAAFGCERAIPRVALRLFGNGGLRGPFSTGSMQVGVHLGR